MGVLVAVLLMCAIPGICYYLRKRRSQARLVQKPIDIERRSGNGSVTVTGDIELNQASPKTSEVGNTHRGSRDSIVTIRDETSDNDLSLQTVTLAENPGLETARGVRTDCDLQTVTTSFRPFRKSVWSCATPSFFSTPLSKRYRGAAASGAKEQVVVDWVGT